MVNTSIIGFLQLSPVSSSSTIPAQPLVFSASPGSSYNTVPATRAPDFSNYPTIIAPMASQLSAVLSGRFYHPDGTEVFLDEYPSVYKGAIFAMSASGDIYVTRYACSHPALLGGAPAAAAGALFQLTTELGVRMLVVSDKSGHYMPPPPLTCQFLSELRDRGVDLRTVLVRANKYGDHALESAEEFISRTFG